MLLTVEELVMSVKTVITAPTCQVKGTPARKPRKPRSRQPDPSSSRESTPSPRDAAATRKRDTGEAARLKPPPRRHEAVTLPERGPPKRAADGDANEAPREKPRTFLPFPRLPLELRALIWHMAAEAHAVEVELNQRCRCARRPGELKFLARRELLRERLALLHACRESREELAPLYDAFEYNRAGMVEAPGDLFLQPSLARPSSRPELSWATDHRYVPFPPMPWHYRHPHMLVDCRRDTFKGTLTWRCPPEKCQSAEPRSGEKERPKYRFVKSHIEGGVFERPETPVSLGGYVQCVRQRSSKTDFEMIEIPPPDKFADDGVPLIAEILL